MAAAIWILLILYPFMAQCQSGDDEPEFRIFCESLLTSKDNSLICSVDDDDDDVDVEFVTLCEDAPSPHCVNASLEQDKYIFQDLEIFPHYKLQVHTDRGYTQEQNILLTKIVKIDAPWIENATYINDGAVIYIKHKHFYVTQPEFQVEISGVNSKYREVVNVNYSNVSIEGDRLKHGETYKVCAKARPVDYFGGQWTEWSAARMFTVENKALPDHEGPLVFYVLLILSLILLILIGFSILHWWKEIQAYLFPAIPHPKATLAQIHREKRSPVSFSPETFKDINIYPVDYIEEKALAPESNDEQGDLSHPLWLYEKEDGDEQRLEAEMSHLKLKLLSECTSAEERENNAGCQSVAAVQGHGKDETYVTMSSLYKTQ